MTERINYFINLKIFLSKIIIIKYTAWWWKSVKRFCKCNTSARKIKLIKKGKILSHGSFGIGDAIELISTVWKWVENAAQWCPLSK